MQSQAFAQKPINRLLADLDKAKVEYKKGNYNNPYVLHVWRGMVRDFDGRWKKYAPSSHFLGKQSKPNKEEKVFFLSGVNTKQEFLKSFLDKSNYASVKNFDNWINKLHKIQAYKGEGGKMRKTDLPPTDTHTQIVKIELPILARKYKDPYKMQGTQIVHLRGIKEKYSSKDEWKNGILYHTYPCGRYRAPYMKMMRKHLYDAIFKGQSVSHRAFVYRIARFYQVASCARMFKNVNHSLFFNMANSLLEVRGFKPIEQGILDFAGMRLQPTNFSKYYLHEVKRRNPHIK